MPGHGSCRVEPIGVPPLWAGAGRPGGPGRRARMRRRRACAPQTPRIGVPAIWDGARVRDAPSFGDTIMFATPAYAQAAGGGAAGALGSFVPLILIFAIMYFLLIRPQQKKVKEHRAMVEALRRGDRVVTQGGLIGKVTKVKDDGELEVEIAQGVHVTVVRSTIAQVLSKTEPAG